MKLTKKQEQELEKFIKNYTNNPQFKKQVQELYQTSPEKLSFLEIYAIEDILRFGTHSIYQNFMKTIGENADSKDINELNYFLKIFQENKEFQKYKLQQFQENKDSLSKIELYALTIILKAKKDSKQTHQDFTNQMDYDPLFPIRYQTDDEIKITLTDLLIGELIHELLELPEMNPIKVRQREPGMIASIDKPTIMEHVLVAIEDTSAQTESVIMNRFIKAKLNVLLGKREQAFEPYLKYRTNISSKELVKYKKNKENKKRRH